MELRKMPWHEGTWLTLRRAAAYIPPTVRMEAVITIVKASEAEAKARDSPLVEDTDLTHAASRKIPMSVRPMALSVLEELGISISDKP